jgi:hypothetical protein
MKLLLPVLLVERLKRELRSVGTREIGGVLVGEHVEDDVFRIVDLSVQRSGGSEAHFTRDPAHSRAFLAEFFARTGNNYERFNYLGEWHSHPLFSVHPSGPDFATMFEIVEDPEVGAHFAVLLIAKLRRLWSGLVISVTVFSPNSVPVGASIELEGDTVRTQVNWLCRLVDIIRR